MSVPIVTGLPYPLTVRKSDGTVRVDGIDPCAWCGAPLLPWDRAFVGAVEEDADGDAVAVEVYCAPICRELDGRARGVRSQPTEEG